MLTADGRSTINDFIIAKLLMNHNETGTTCRFYSSFRTQNTINEPHPKPLPLFSWCHLLLLLLLLLPWHPPTPWRCGAMQHQLEASDQSLSRNKANSAKSDEVILDLRSTVQQSPPQTTNGSSSNKCSNNYRNSNTQRIASEKSLSNFGRAADFGRDTGSVSYIVWNVIVYGWPAVLWCCFDFWCLAREERELNAHY